MKAVAITNYGSVDVLKILEVDRPTIRADQLLVKVSASSVNPVDWKIRQGRLKILTGWRFPLILGFDVAGEVVDIGERVSQFQPGDKVFTYLDQLPGGAYAEYVAVSASVICHQPHTLTQSEAAAIPLAATTALQALRNRGKIAQSHHVLINGASGGVGIYALQIAKAFGADVTAVCSSNNAELVKRLGCDHHIDYQQTDFTQRRSQYDIVLDAVSNRSFAACQSCLKPQGIYLSLLPSLELFWRRFWPHPQGKKGAFVLARSNGNDLRFLKHLVEAGRLQVAIDRTYDLADMASAHTYSESGRVAGKLVIRVTDG